MPERHFIARNKTAEAARARQLIESKVAASCGLEYAFSVAIDSTDWQVAHGVGGTRTLIAKARNLNGDQYRRGKNDERVDAEGALAEWVLFNALGKAADTCAPLVEYKANRDACDLVLGGQPYEIKSVSQSTARCCINKEQHERKRPAGCLVVKITSERIVDVYVVSGAAVEGWPQFEGFSPYYAVRMPPPLPVPMVEAET